MVSKSNVRFLGFGTDIHDPLSMIGYPNYKFYFPIRALGKYEQVYVPWLNDYKEPTAKKY